MIHLFVILLHFVLYCSSKRLSEPERVQEWHNKNGNTWPPLWQNETLEYKQVMADREEEIMQIPGANERWENWMQFTQGRLVPKFTTHGFEVIQTPKATHETLDAFIADALSRYETLPNEYDINAIYGKNKPLFVNIGNLASDVLNDLQSIHEEWAGGIKLRGTSAYGVRLYKNGSSLIMHYDKVHSHVISSIVHIAHEYDDEDEPWPIQIEDHNGKLHSVNLEPGQMLFYESSKCLHGRMKVFKGKYYGSIFLHYAPVDKSIWDYSVDDVIASVPPHWKDNIVEDTGSRWAGQGITVDSRASFGSNPRIVRGEFIHDNKSPYAYYNNISTLNPTIHEEL